MSTPTIKKLSLSEVKPYWRNPRINDSAVEAVMKSIQEYGYNQYIAVDKKNVIISGHTRHKALTRLGYTEIDVFVLDLSPQKAKQYRIVDNKTSELAEWDMKALIPELREIENVTDLEIFFPDVDVSSLVKESVGNIKFDEVTQADLDQKKKELQEKFTRINEGNMESKLEVICPCCNETFFLDRQDVLKR
jgi:ParB-like chromosome segregation protein Spo0J